MISPKVAGTARGTKATNRTATKGAGVATATVTAAATATATVAVAVGNEKPESGESSGRIASLVSAALPSCGSGPIQGVRTACTYRTGAGRACIGS